MTKPLSPPQTQILTAAKDHAVGLAAAPPGLPVAARAAVFRSMLNSGLLEEVPAPDGASMTLRITAAGREAVGVETSSTEPVGEAAAGAKVGEEEQEGTTTGSEAGEARVSPSVTPQPRTTLRYAATALLGAWDADEGRPDLPGATETLRAALSQHSGTLWAPRGPATPRRPREGTKQQAVLTLPRRSEGATVAQVMEATGWAQHTVRGFLAGLKKKGHAVTALERVRQVGPNRQGAKGSYTVYSLGEGQG
jgi:hypothetical protein